MMYNAYCFEVDGLPAATELAGRMLLNGFSKVYLRLTHDDRREYALGSRCHSASNILNLHSNRLTLHVFLSVNCTGIRLQR